MMTRVPRSVKRAADNRSRMIGAARELFVSTGYAETTIEQIAHRAGVSVQTVYYRFGSKGRLLCEVTEATARGSEEPVRPGPPPWLPEMLAAASPAEVLELGVRHGTAIYDRVAALWPAVHAATSTDRDVDTYWREVTERRRSGQVAMVGRVAELGGLRPGLDPAHATDLIVVLLGHDVYRGLVLDAGWTPAAYREWLLTTLSDQLLG
jgi:TetR/AcrR family transcriptional regulator of autoinduction and epiphytic fitness